MKTQTTMRAAIYARVSSEEQLAGYSIDAQIRECRKLATDKGWIITSERIEEGKSARTDVIARRPQFQALLQDVQAGRLDVVITHKLDRLSRNMRITLESFDAFARANIAYASVVEAIDYTTAQGKLFLHMLAAFAQFYSDNLSQETKKGKRERKLQGYYNGLLPFGTVKGPQGLPIPDMRPHANNSTNYDGLQFAFREAASGKSDRDIARALNAKGYRTTGNRGENLFTKDTVCPMLRNRFYLGELPDGDGGWLPGKHQAFVDAETFDKAQDTRQANRNEQRVSSVKRGARTYSLTGLLRCGHCRDSGDPRRGSVHIEWQHGTARVNCYSRKMGITCEQRSTSLDVYEEQVQAWLDTLVLPADAVEMAIAEYAKQRQAVGDMTAERQRLLAKIERVKELYTWGDIDRARYLVERDQLQAQVRALGPQHKQERDITKMVDLVRRVGDLWREAGPSDRNKLLSQIVAQVVIRGNAVHAIEPRPHFMLLLKACQPSSVSSGSDGLWLLTILQRLYSGRYAKPRHNLTPDTLKAIADTARHTSIIGAARSHGVARQTVRRALALSVASSI